MSRRNLVWLLTLPLAIVGTQVAHALAYRFATSGDVERAHELSSTGHAYLTYAPLALAVCAALVALALARELLGLRAGRVRGARPSALTFAVLAPIGGLGTARTYLATFRDARVNLEAAAERMAAGAGTGLYSAPRRGVEQSGSSPGS